VCVYTTRASTQRQQTLAIFGHGSDGERSKRRKKNRESKEIFLKIRRDKKIYNKNEEMMIVRRWPVIVVRLSTKIRKRKKNRRADHRLENEFRHPSP
jgi:hypothetical protein